MKPIIINKGATINGGLLAGMSGRVVGADVELGTVTLEIERGTYVEIDRERVSQ